MRHAPAPLRGAGRRRSDGDRVRGHHPRTGTLILSAPHHLVEIHDRTAAGDLVDLAEVLDALPVVAAALPWRMLAVRATPIARPAIDLREYFAVARGAPESQPVDWDDLYVLARNTTHVTDALIVAPHPDRRAPLASDDDMDLLAASVVVIAAAGSVAWTLWIPDEWLAPISRRFHDVRAVIPGEQPLTR